MGHSPAGNSTLVAGETSEIMVMGVLLRDSNGNDVGQPRRDRMRATCRSGVDFVDGYATACT